MVGAGKHLVLLSISAFAVALTTCATCHAAPAASILQQPQGEIFSTLNMVGQVEAMEEELIAVLDPPEPKALQESIHIDNMEKLELNLMRRLTPHSSRGHIVCPATTSTTASTGISAITDVASPEENVRKILADLDSLPECPQFAPCMARTRLGDPLEPEHTNPGTFQEAASDAEASIAACHTMLGRDPPHFIFMGEPDNCPKLPGHSLTRSWEDAHSSPWDGLDPSCSIRQDYVPLPPTGFDVVRLRRVYVNGQGLVFNRSTLFFRQGCQDGKQGDQVLQYSAHSRNVTHVHRAFNLAYRQIGNFFHTLIETIAMLIEMAHFVSRDPDLPVLGFRTNFEAMEGILRPILGASPMKLRRYEMKSGSLERGDLFHIDTLFQPILPVCGSPDPQLWRHLRRHHILPRDGLPIFNDDWTLRRPNAKPLSHAQMAAYPSDWVVVAARREGTKRVLRQMPQIIALLQQLFGKERVVTFWGKRSILQARDLFRRARLYVAGHGAGQSNMVFMPANSTILEIRPRGKEVACYHALAEACNIHYNLLLADNPETREELTFYDVDMSRVEEILHKIATTFS